MRLLIHSASSPAEDLALEESIHLCVEDGSTPDTWRLWSPSVPAVIIGTGQESAREVNLANARAEFTPVLRRHSGGGTVLIGPGAINYSAFFRYENKPGSETIHGATAVILQSVIDALQEWNLHAVLAGHSDLATLCADGTLRKLAGNSQARKKRSAVVHGTLLAAPDWARINRLLNFPTSIPDYRAGRNHREFLTSLKECGAPYLFEDFRRELAKHLPLGTVTSFAPADHEIARARELYLNKYNSNDWNLRR